jgi:hypothetical protein
MKKQVSLLTVMLLMAAAAAAGDSTPPATLPPEDHVQPSSLELEQRVEPWCPGNCAVTVPFVAIYRNGIERLVFVASHHAFQQRILRCGRSSSALIESRLKL